MTYIDEAQWEKLILGYLDNPKTSVPPVSAEASRTIAVDSVRVTSPIATAIAATTINSTNSATSITRPISVLEPVRPITVTNATALRVKQWELIDKPQIKAHWAIRELPYFIIDPAPTLAEPVRVGDFLLWPDAAQQRVFYALAVPQLSEFSLTLQRDSNARLMGGTAVVTLRVYAPANPTLLARQYEAWTKHLSSIGQGRLAWKFQPLNLRNLTATLSLPAGYTRQEPAIATSTSEGNATCLIQLTPEGALAWSTALEGRNPGAIQGVCTLNVHYYTQINRRISVKQQTLSASLGNLAAQMNLGPEVIQTIRQETTVEARFVVVGHATVESVLLELHPNGGRQPVSHYFTSGGGTATLQLTAPNLDEVEVDWTVVVNFKPSGWPIVRLTGKLGQGRWAEIVKPDAWMSSYTLTAMLLDGAGDVLPANSDGDIDPLNRVQADLSFTAPYIEGGGPLHTTLETSSQQVIEVTFPLPPGVTPGAMKLTLFALRAGRDDMQIRMLNRDETMIIAKVYANARIELVTNRDPVTESSTEEELLGILGMLRGEG